MKYNDLNKKQALPNKEVDRFLMELHVICKKHKMCISTTNSKYPLVITKYDKGSVKNMLGNVALNLESPKKEKKEVPKIPPANAKKSV